MGEYNGDWEKTMPFGCHVHVVHEGGGQSYTYRIEPAIAPLVAAAMIMRDDLVGVIREAAEYEKPKKELLTERQHAAWKEFNDAFGGSISSLRGKSIHDVANQVLSVIAKRAENMLTNDAMKEAYDQFITVATLSKE